MVFPVVMYGCESWTVKMAEHWRIDAFELWCWRRLLRVPQTARRSNQSILKRSVLGVHWKDWCWSWNSNTLTTWCKELTHLKRPWCWERLKAGGEGDDRGWDGWMASPTWRTWVWASCRRWRGTGKPGVLPSMGWGIELNWTIKKAFIFFKKKKKHLIHALCTACPIRGKIGTRKRRGRQRMGWLDGITDSTDMGLGELWELVIHRDAWRAVVHGVTKSQTSLSNELNWKSY